MGVLQNEVIRKLEYSTHTEKFMRQLFSMNEEFPMPKTKSKKGIKKVRNYVRQWIYVGTKKHMESTATMSSLFAKMNYYLEENKKSRSHDVTYFTPNGYFMRNKRHTETLRGLNAFVLDFDLHTDWYEILEKIDECGLPMPTLINKTGKGLHIYFVFNKSVRATPKSIRLYNAIHKYMINDVGADKFATGANRIYRLPTDETIVYYEPSHVYDFDVFKDWRNINYPYEPSKEIIRVYCDNTLSIMSHPAIQKILHTPTKKGIKDYISGNRDTTLYTLSLACKYSQLPFEQALELLEQWFNECCQVDHEFNLACVEKKLEYVYYRSTKIRPSEEDIEKLSHMEFKYNHFVRRFYTPAKKREERLRTHLTEWKDDLISLLERKKGLVCCTQKELAEKLDMPLITLKVILRDLKKEGKILVDSTKGRNGKTTIILVETKSKAKKVKVAEGHELIVPVDVKTESEAIHAAYVGESTTEVMNTDRVEDIQPSTALIIAFPQTRRIKPSKQIKNAREGIIVPFVIRSHPPPD